MITGDLQTCPARAVEARPAPPSQGSHGIEPWTGIVRAAAGLESLSLEGVGKAALLDRTDTKFVIPIQALPAILAWCAPHYRVLEIAGARLRAYRTRYYDTPDLACYQAHHAGRLPRYKVRVRSYLETGQEFLEVKLKTNRGRTLKSRLPLAPAVDPIGLLAQVPLLGIARAVAPASLRPLVAADYTRITLVSRTAAERVTVDLALEFARGSQAAGYPALVIAEVKQERQGHSDFAAVLRRQGYRERRISKYCLGVATLVPGVRKNRFLPLLHHVQRLSGNHVPSGTR